MAGQYPETVGTRTQRRAAILLRAFDVNLIRDVPVHGDGRLADLKDIGRRPLEQPEAAPRDDSERRQLFEALFRLGSDEDDPRRVAQARVGETRDKRLDLGPDPVATLAPRDRAPVGTHGRMAEEGADAFRHLLCQNMLELAGAALDLRVDEIEKVVQKNLGEPVSADDSTRPVLPGTREPDLVPPGFHEPRRLQLFEEPVGLLL